jgi:hypothetical protein
MLLLQGSPLGAEPFLIEMALVVLSIGLEIVNTTMVRSCQRSLAASAGSLRADLFDGWLIRSLNPIRLIHAHTRMQKTATLSEAFPCIRLPEASSENDGIVEEATDDKRLDALVEQVIHLSRTWNARQSDEVHEEPRSGRLSDRRLQWHSFEGFGEVIEGLPLTFSLSQPVLTLQYRPKCRKGVDPDL